MTISDKKTPHLFNISKLATSYEKIKQALSVAVDARYPEGHQDRAAAQKGRAYLHDITCGISPQDALERNPDALNYIAAREVIMSGIHAIKMMRRSHPISAFNQGFLDKGTFQTQLSELGLVPSRQDPEKNRQSTTPTLGS